ncbi:MAG: DNA polymerase III subunit alpha, partial [Treponema sp.]|nr:DNA polymerase III subunit alpha [Treponema sp.]
DGNPNFYLEIMDHNIPADELGGSNYSQKQINDIIFDISKKTGIPLAATNDVHYLEKDDYVSHDILLCIGTGKKRKEEKRKKYYGDQFYFKTGDEMAEAFSEYPDAVINTVRIANRCNADIPNREKELMNFLPDYKIPDGFKDADDYLRHLTMEGLKKRYRLEEQSDKDKWNSIIERANYELDTICKTGYSGYFLIVEDFINFANKRGIPVGPGRGSGAGSIVAYALRITNIEPLRYNLLFERFINLERVSMPDFDIDFANEGREEVIKYVTEKYGEDRVGQIITFGTLGAKAVVKDVARVLDIPIPESEMITKLISKDPKITLEKAFAEEPRLAELEHDARYTELFHHARKLEGLNRHSSIHAAGVVIGRHPLIDLVPLYQERDDSKKGKEGGIATQFSMNYLEKCGLVKMDFLGLKTLDVIKHTENLIHRRGGEYAGFSIENIPQDDKKTFKMLGEGNCFAIFQFERDFIQDFVKQAKPSSIEDLTALNAMNRPGPMKHLPQFVDSKSGNIEITYPHPSLEKILKETYGVIVYQEQVMQIAQIVAGFSLGHADELRRAMGKKIMAKMESYRIKFLEGAKERGYSEQKAHEIFELLKPFADYGFNKSHAAAYAIIAYQTAYLKTHFPAEFMAANLTNDINSADKNRLGRCIEESRRMGLVVEPPNVNNSDNIFSVVDGRIVYGFMGIKGIGSAPSQEIVKSRQEEPYKNFMDFLDKTDIKSVGKKTVLLLVQSGAFDSFGITRETLEHNLEKAVEYAQKKKEDKLLGQTSLFEDSGESDMPDFVFQESPTISRADKLNKEKELLGFYLSGHPMDDYKELWQNNVTVDLGRNEDLKTGSCLLIGIIKSIKQIVTAKGARMAFAALADYNGEIEVTFFSGAWDKLSGKIESDKVSILKGKIEYQKDKYRYTFVVDDIVSRHEIDKVVKEIKETEEKETMHRNTWLYMADLKSSILMKAKKGNYTIIGYLKSLRDFTDVNGNEMAFGSLKDFEGDIDLVFFNKVYSECRHLLNLGEMIALKGSIDPENERNPEKIGFKVTSIADFAQLSRSAKKKEAAGEKPQSFEPEKPAKKQFDEVHIRFVVSDSYDDENLAEFRDFLAENSGSCSTYIHIPVSDGEQTIRSALGLDISGAESEETIIDGLKKCKCVADVWRK